MSGCVSAAAIRVKRSSMGVYFKVFIGLFAGMLLTFTSFAIRASEGGQRVSMPVGSYFGAVANSYLVKSAGIGNRLQQGLT